MQASNECIALIRRFEGLVTKAYKCPAGVWTLGYGHTAGVNANDVITSAQAEALLEADVSVISKSVSKLLAGTKIKQCQFDALVSFTFNVGTNALAFSTLLKFVLAGKTEQAADQFLRWVYVTNPKTKTKMKLAGLEARRRAEKELFLRD